MWKDIDIIKIANILARKHGYLKATKVICGSNFKLIKAIRYGYRKFTTGEYVPHKYRCNFGWKNTYYQKAIFEIQIPEDIFSANYNQNWPYNN